MTWRLTLPSIEIVALLTLLIPLERGVQQSNTSLTPPRIFEAVNVREGSTVCEVGAGDGELTIAAARMVGPSGRVYTNELGDEKVKTLQQRVAASELSQITVVAGDMAATNFPDGACDALFMRDVYHHFAEPAAMNAAIVRSLKPGARVAIVDFTPPGKEADRPVERGRDGMHGVLPDTVSREMQRAGLEAVTSESGGRWFLVVLAKPQPPLLVSWLPRQQRPGCRFPFPPFD